MKKFYSSILGLCLYVVAAAQYTTIVGPTNSGNPINMGTNPYTLTTEDNHFGQARGVYKTATQNLQTAFSVCANLNFGRFNESGLPNNTDFAAPAPALNRTGADGIAFVLSAGGYYVGETGEEMGYGTSFYPGPPPTGFTPRNTFAVEFDTWQNSNTVNGARNLGDPAADHMAFMRRGSASHLNTNGIDNSVTPIVSLPELETGAPFPVKFSWSPITGLTVDFNNGTMMTASASDVLAALGSPGNSNVNVNWGFNAGTGLAANQQTVQIVTCAAVACTLTVSATLPALSCDGANVIYLGYGPQCVTATSNQAGTTFQWFMVGNAVAVSNGATFCPTQAGTFFVVATNGTCTASTAGTPSVITVIDVRCYNPGKDAPHKIYVCHKKNGTNGNGTIGDNAHTLCVDADAVPAHLAHGDCLGQCPNGNRAAPGAEPEVENSTVLSAPAATVYPNPSRGQVQLNLPSVNTKAQIMIVNSRGVVVERRAAGNAQSFSFDLKKYGVGVYLVKIVSGNDVQTSKVIVQE